MAVTVAVVLGSAGPAAAHASLISTDPAQGAVLATAPDQITFSFDEPVVAVSDGVQVFDAEGGSIGSSATVTGTELAVRLTGPHPDGTLVITWRVVSSDGHPVTGSLSFAIGAPSARVTTQTVAQASTEAPPWLSVTRWTGYAGLLLAGGLVAFLVLSLRPQEAVGVHRRVVTVTRAAAAVAAGSWLLGLPLAGAYQLGEGAVASLDDQVWSTLATADYVVAGAVVLGLAAAVVLLGDGRPNRTRGRWAVTAAAAAAAAPALTGHTRAATPQGLAIGSDVLHLLAGSVWLGGLAGLALVLPAMAAREPAAAQVVARFSAVAAGALALLVLAGSVLSWHIVASWAALTDTGYGRLLLLKIGVVAVALLIAAWNRFVLVPRTQRSDDPPGRQRAGRLVARSTAAEAAVLTAALLVTGFLVDTSPEGGAARAATTRAAGGAPDAAGRRTATLGDVVVEADISPRTAGPTTVTIRLRHTGGGPAVGVESLTARLASDAADLGEIPLAFVAEGEYASEVVLPAPGAWRLQVSVRRSEFVNPVTTLEFAVAS